MFTKKLENIRAIKPAIALIEGENFIDGTSLLDNHELYNWIEDSTLCANDQCETGVTKYRSIIPLNANSKISSTESQKIKNRLKNYFDKKKKGILNGNPFNFK